MRGQSAISGPFWRAYVELGNASVQAYGNGDADFTAESGNTTEIAFVRRSSGLVGERHRHRHPASRRLQPVPQSPEHVRSPAMNGASGGQTARMP